MDVREGFGMITINQGDGNLVDKAQFGFSLVSEFDFDTIKTTGEGLLFNMSTGDNIGDPSLQKIGNFPWAKINIVKCNPREWNEFWIQIKKYEGADTTGTHSVKIWLNGDVDSPHEFVATVAGKGYNDVPYMQMGSTQSTESMAMDVDYNAFAVGLIDPVASSVGTFDMSFGGTQLKSYPNPSTGDVTFSFNLKRAGYTTLEVFNLIGQPVAKVLAKDLPAGAHSIQRNVDLLPGQYVYRLQSGNQNEIRKMTILK